MAVDVFYWNPKVLPAEGPIKRRIAWRLRRIVGTSANNFGDMLAPLVVRGLAAVHDRELDGGRDVRLLSVGSVLESARPGDVVWGSGLREPLRRGLSMGIDVRAVRGPLTRKSVIDAGLDAPEIYGDPALLLPELMPELRMWANRPVHDVTVVPHLFDWPAVGRRDDRYLNPRRPLMECLERIATSRYVVASSLHAVIVADSLGIPSRLFRPLSEPMFKYEDYAAATGRSLAMSDSVDHALADGPWPEMTWDPRPLREAFPLDLWT